MVNLSSDFLIPRKLLSLLFVAGLSITTAQDVTLECDFMNYFGDYTCRLNDIEVVNEAANVVFTGTHLEGRTNADVELVQIRNSRTPFMIQSMFSTFPNMEEFECNDCGLESINMPEPTRIRILAIPNNNIQRIEDNTFVNQPQLLQIRLTNSNVHELGEDAFVGLSNLTTLGMINNRIREIQPRTFNPLTSVTYIDLERNNLTRVDDIYSMNLNLESIYLEFNQIEAISPNFVRHLRGGDLWVVNLNGNVCVQRRFNTQTDSDWILMNNALNGCFRNFVGPQDDIVVECDYWLNFWDEYECRLREIEVLNEFADVVFTGTHLEGLTNDDVVIVDIANSVTPFMIREVFTTFPNIIELEYDRCELELINLPEETLLESLVVINNNISTIDERTFAGSPHLRLIRLTNNNIQVLHPDAFVGLGNLTNLGLINNRIQEINQRTFNPLQSVTYLDLERNNLTRVDNIFSMNLALQSLYLEFNQIAAISSTFLSHMAESNLNTLNLNGNVCIQRSFYFGSIRDETWISLNNAIQPCFRAFDNIPDEAPKRYTFEYTGSLIICDPAGNVLARL